MFEQLLIKELQRQQHRTQFCDTVLQAQGVSVPVHSCVLSAFSPRLCEFLSTLPALPGGKSRVIELQAVEAYTLLRLVSALYTGTVEGERRDLQKAADTLGITLPQETGETGEGEWEGGGEPLKDTTLRRKGGSEEGVGGKGTDRRVCNDAETQTDVILTNEGRHMAETDLDTDTDTQRHMAETDLDTTSSQDAQFMCVRPNTVEFQTVVPHESVGHMSQFPWVTEGCLQTSSDENPLMAPSDDDVCTAVVIPSTLDDATVCQLISEVTVGAPGGSCSSLLPPPPEDQPKEKERLRMSTTEDGGELVDGFEQFEGNIPEFISYFLDLAGPRRAGHQVRRSPRRMKREEKRGSERARRLRGGMGKDGEERQGTGKVACRFPLREGRPVVLTWRGLGGGRIGRLIHLPPRKKARSRPCVRQSSAQGKAEPSQNKIPAIRKPRRRIQLLPLQAHLECDTLPPTPTPTPTPSYLSLSPSILHTLPLPPATQPRFLLEQLLTELNQPSGATEALNSHSTLPANTTSPRMLYSSGNADARSSQQQQPEGEVNDMLDHLLLSLEQPVDMRPYTVIKKLQEGHRREEVRSAVYDLPRAHTPLLHAHPLLWKAPEPSHTQPQQHWSEASLSVSNEWLRIPKASLSGATLPGPSYHPHCKPSKHKTKCRRENRRLAEISLKEEMFEERRMTRNQANILRISHEHTTAAGAASTGPGVPVPKHPRLGKNMKILRQKLLGKRKREEDEEVPES
ncbi:uncharacterized protein LOC122128552 [Clupea harengus]|uniref:Uncharacterized protein LOC122128552 n=1 Tax=Clupea harengus TaxID=7950 RepID=A0A8M1K9M5_CLUHA|nr:uncharacterized protein LOC122128552 [Clupea harengus]